MSSGPAAFLAFIFLNSFLTWFVVRDNLEQWLGVLDGVGGGTGLVVMGG